MKTFLCNVKGKDWEREVQGETMGNAKAAYLHDVRDAWPDIPYTAITARELKGRPQNKAEDLQRQCDEWNAAHPIGTTVAYHPVIGESPYRATRTKTAAYVLSGHTAVLHVEGESGCVALEAIEAAGKQYAGPVRPDAAPVLYHMLRKILPAANDHIPHNLFHETLDALQASSLEEPLLLDCNCRDCQFRRLRSPTNPPQGVTDGAL